MSQNQSNKTNQSLAPSHAETTAKLLTEVACCTIDIHDEITEDVKVCETAISCLGKEKPALLDDFKNATNKTLQDKDAEYTIKQYDGKSDDLRKAVRLLETHAKASNTDTETLAEQKEMMTKAAKLLVDFYDMDIKDGAYFITEQACSLIQALGIDSGSKHISICEQAMEFISNGNDEQMKAFKSQTLATKHDPDADYDTEEYDGKKTDILHAVTDIIGFADSPNTPTEQKEILTEMAEMIAEFYGVDEEISEVA